MHWRYSPEAKDLMMGPQSLDTWDYLGNTAKWVEEKKAKGEEY